VTTETGSARVGAFLSPRGSLVHATRLARHAEDLGYDSVWVTHGVGRDGFLVLSAFAQATVRIGLGTGVMPIYPRHPVLMAQEAATLAELSHGRLRLGIGVSHRSAMTGALGLDMGAPLAVMREYVKVLRAGLDGAAHLSGARYRVAWDGAVRAPGLPVLLAGLAVPMLELAGEVADGGFEVVAAVPAAVTEDLLGVGRTFREELARYLTLPYYRTMLRASGFSEGLDRFDRDRVAGVPADVVPAAMVDALGVVGSADAVRASVEAYRTAGVTLPVVRPIGAPEAPHAGPTLEAAAP